jgi:DNA topoisomerase-1
MDGTMLQTLRTRAEREMSDSLGELRPEEAAILALLQQRLARGVELAREGA